MYIESLHKICREEIRRHTILRSATSINLSLMLYLLVCSDPVIASKFVWPEMKHISQMMKSDSLVQTSKKRSLMCSVGSVKITMKHFSQICTYLAAVCNSFR